MEDLAWLGLSWEQPVRFQSEHLSDYHAALQSLWAQGTIFPCFCSRKQAAEHALSSTDPDGQIRYGGTCRSLSREEAQQRLARGDLHGWRLKTENTPAHLWGDVTIAKPSVGSLYHIAVVVDDALQGVTHVVRGQDMEAATLIHQVLQRHLGFPQPHYHHHKLILDASGQKLSKSLSSTGIRALRESGVTADELKRRLGF
jgi:glutamyl-Q tRNA(Asp) synthetase